MSSVPGIMDYQNVVASVVVIVICVIVIKVIGNCNWSLELKVIGNCNWSLELKVIGNCNCVFFCIINYFEMIEKRLGSRLNPTTT